MTDEEIARHLRNMPALQAFCPSGRINTEVVVDTLCRYCIDIRYIEFKYFHELSNSRLHEILKKYLNLEEISIPLPIEDQLHFADLVGQLQNLITLIFHARNVTVADGVLRAIADGCPSLECLDLGFAQFPNQEVEYFLEKKGQQLCYFKYTGYMSKVAHRLLTECANLRVLTYKHCNEDLPSTDIHRLSKLSEMECLRLICISEGRTQDVSTIFKNQSMSKLYTLDICYCSDFDSTSLAVILTNCPQLESFAVRDCLLTDEGFQYIGNCKDLEYLDISGCPLITDKAMLYIGAGCPNLSYLNIANCLQLTNKGIEYICSGCQTLKKLDMQNCREMTDDVMKHIIRCKQLEVLELSCNCQLLGIHFHLIPSNLIHLTALYAMDCFSLDEKCISKLKEEMPHLLIVKNSIKKGETDVNVEDDTVYIYKEL
ncbi:hypothetical protein B7P43_G01358 [Cryptotermes secundus]|nr:hypothetical protein B7P43_G01358 [Cryptotermes secundus]